MANQQDEAAYAAQTIRSFLNKTCGPYDWDDFISCPIRDPEVNNIRLRARNLDLPVVADAERELLALADEADRLAMGNGS